jgi:hypothetical protein
LFFGFDSAKIGIFLLPAINSNIFNGKCYEIKEITSFLVDFIFFTATPVENRLLFGKVRERLCLDYANIRPYLSDSYNIVQT